MSQIKILTPENEQVSQSIYAYCSSINGTQSKYDAAISHQRALRIKFRDHT